MQILPQAIALLAACAVGGVRAASPTSGVMELDLAFPRNQTYAPAARLPVVFAYQNPELATALNARVSFTAWNWDDMRNNVAGATFSLDQANLSSRDPFLQYGYFGGFEAEGHWLLTWTVDWDNCTEDSLALTNTNKRITHSIISQAIHFSTNHSAPKIDLVAATNNKDCPRELGLTFNVTGALKVPAWVDWSGGDHCAKVAESMPTPSPCRVQIDSAAASSMAASMTAKACANKGVAPPEGVECPPEDKSSAQQLAVTGLACLAATVGAFGYVLMV
ncbi:hypothetical protein PGQ11_014805 [Apiospora arundinis]|uniref:DUF7136 domain-containing protein n=1 Tax=Apiospora arundinis TaxID=335852 RepID=A0ABR2HTG9_9PEZI